MQSYKHLLILLISLISLSTLAQTSKKTLNYQAVILDPKAIDIPGAVIAGQPLNKGNVCLRFSLINAQGGLDYEETQQVITDEFGLVNVAIGTGAQANTNNSTSIYKGFDAIQWNTNVKSLKVSVSYDGCNSFKQVSTQALNYTPYALYAEAVDYKNVREAPTKLSQFSNDAGYLIPKDLDPLKSEIATANQTIAENNKSSEASFLIANQNITSLQTKVVENTKAINQNTSSISTISTKLTDQQNQIFDNRNQISATNNNLTTQIGGLQGQLSVTNSTVSNLSGASEVVSNKSSAVDLGAASPSDQLYPSQKAAKTYIDQSISRVATSGVPDATTLAAGKLQLSGDLGGTATSPTVPALASKENTVNKSTSVQTDGGSNTKYPSVKAVKDYVDQATMGTALQATVDAKADKNSPTFTGTPVLPTGTTAITQTSTDNSTKLATTAFVQQATAGIALQAAVDAKADKNSPTFTGTPVLPTGTTAITQTAGNNTTSLATTAFVQQATAAGTIDASTSLKGKIKLAGDLGGTADSPSVPGLALKANSADVTSSLGGKEDLSNKSTTTTLGTSDVLYPSQKAVKTYVDAQIASATIADAEATIKGKLKLTNDLGGTADSPTVPGLLLKAPIASPTFTGTVSGVSKAMVGLGNVDNTTDAAKPVSTATQTALDAKANAIATTDALALKAPLASPTFTGAPALPTGTTAITQTAGDNTTKLATTAFVASSVSTGAPDATTSTTGKIQLAGDLGGTAASPTVPGLTSKANTTDVTNSLALKAPLASPTFTGTVAGISKAMVGLANVDNTTDAAKPVSTATQTGLDAKANATATTDALALKAPLASPTFTGTPVLPTGTTAITQTAGDNTTSLATTAFVQQATAAGAPNATTSTTGKIQLAGDLGGTATSPTIAANAIITSKIADANVTYAKIQLVSATDKVLGRITAGSGIVEEISTVGSGNVVRATSPTLVTPVLGVASATSVNKLTLTAPATAATLTIVNGKTFTSSNTLTLAGTDASTLNIGAGGTLGSNAYNSTGYAPLVSPAFTGTPVLNTATATSLSLSGQLTSTIATGTAPFIVSSATPVANLSIGGNATNVTGTVAVANGGTGASTLTANAVLLGNGTSALQAVAPGTSGNVLTSNGTTWTSAAAAGGHAIGDSYGGGIVFYVYDGGNHGLIAATADQNGGAGIRWYGGTYTNTRARADGVGAGLKNTVIIIANQGQVDGNAFAATVCNEYSVTVDGVTYGDWYLPSKYEIALLFLKRSVVGGFSTYYWTSSESVGGQAWYQDFVDGGGGSGATEQWLRVRAIRAF